MLSPLLTLALKDPLAHPVVQLVLPAQKVQKVLLAQKAPKVQKVHRASKV
jgi:hypothetical protein